MAWMAENDFHLKLNLNYCWNSNQAANQLLCLINGILITALICWRWCWCWCTLNNSTEIRTAIVQIENEKFATKFIVFNCTTMSARYIDKPAKVAAWGNVNGRILGQKTVFVDSTFLVTKTISFSFPNVICQHNWPEIYLFLGEKSVSYSKNRFHDVFFLSGRCRATTNSRSQTFGLQFASI